MSDSNHPLLLERKSCLLQAEQISRAAKKAHRDTTADEDAKIEDLLARAEQCKESWEAEPQPRQTRQPPLHQGGFGVPTRMPSFGHDGASVANRLFGQQTNTDGFSSFGDWLQCLDSGRFDTRMRAASNEGVDSEGGFLVPSVYQNAYIDAVIEQSVILSRVRKVPMSSDTLNLSGWDGNDHTSNLFGGFVAGWEAELDTLDGQTPKTRRISLHARKLMILTQASNELIADAIGYETMLGQALIQATSWQLDYEILRGSGAGRPLGCINADSTIEITKESSQTAATIWYTNVVKMLSRLHPACYKNAIWVASPTIIPQLMSLDSHESAAALGSGLVGDVPYRPFNESNGTFSLFGRPVEFTEKLPTLGTKGDIMLVDPTAYVLGMRQGIVVEKSVHAGFSSDSSFYRSKMRVDGQPLWAAAMTPRNGDSLSWCVVLATRE